MSGEATVLLHEAPLLRSLPCRHWCLLPVPSPGRPYYDTGERPDVWFEPTEVWEIRGADITVSPVHRAAAGLVDPVKGLGLRFPRFLRLRPDKKPEEASGPDTVQELYNKQNRRIRHD